MAVATLIAIPAPRSFVVVDTRFTSALLVKLPLYKARQRHLFHQRSMSWLHLSWVVRVLCRSVNLGVMATTLFVERQRHQDPRHLRAGHCAIPITSNHFQSLPITSNHLKSSRFVEEACSHYFGDPWAKWHQAKNEQVFFAAHAEIYGLTICNLFCKSQGHHVKGFKHMEGKDKIHQQSAKSTQTKLTKTRHITLIQKEPKKNAPPFCASCASHFQSHGFSVPMLPLNDCQTMSHDIFRKQLPTSSTRRLFCLWITRNFLRYEQNLKVNVTKDSTQGLWTCSFVTETLMCLAAALQWA